MQKPFFTAWENAMLEGMVKGVSLRQLQCEARPRQSLSHTGSDMLMSQPQGGADMLMSWS